MVLESIGDEIDTHKNLLNIEYAEMYEYADGKIHTNFWYIHRFILNTSKIVGQLFCDKHYNGEDLKYSIRLNLINDYEKFDSLVVSSHDKDIINYAMDCIINETDCTFENIKMDLPEHII